MLKLQENKKTVAYALIFAAIGVLIYAGVFKNKPSKDANLPSLSNDTPLNSTAPINNNDNNNPSGGSADKPSSSPEKPKTQVVFGDLNPSSKTVKVNQLMNVITYIDHPEAKIILKATQGGITKTFNPTSVGEGGGVSWEFKLDTVGEWSLQAFADGNYEGSSKMITITVQP